MAAAGLEGALPMSFGGRATGGGSSRKRRRAARGDESCQAEKVHVKFDSDGEVAERRVEVVEVPLEEAEKGEKEAVKADDRRDGEGDTVERESAQQEEIGGWGR